jgi:homocysteine S-methyltransferase
LCIGDSFADAYEQFRNNEQLIAIGINCTYPLYVTALLKSVKKFSTPFVVYPNGGYIWDASKNK